MTRDELVAKVEQVTEEIPKDEWVAARRVLYGLLGAVRVYREGYLAEAVAEFNRRETVRAARSK